MADTASDLFVERLMEWGVDTVFGLPGDGINGFMEALRKRQDRLRYIHVRHEEVGAMAAVGYARLTGRLGVCFATSGPGAIHLANGLLDARLEGVPLLAVTGMTYHDLIGTHYLQDFDTDYLYSNLAAYNQRIMAPEHIEAVLDLACRTALSNRREESRTRIGLTIGRSILREATEPASPYGVLGRVREKVGGGRSAGDGANGDGAR